MKETKIAKEKFDFEEDTFSFRMPKELKEKRWKFIIFFTSAILVAFILANIIIKLLEVLF